MVPFDRAMTSSYRRHHSVHGTVLTLGNRFSFRDRKSDRPTLAIGGLRMAIIMWIANADDSGRFLVFFL